MNHQAIQRTLAAALALHQRGDHAEAAQLCEQACQAAPQVFDCWYLSGTLAFQQGRTAEAVELLNRARRLDPKSAPCKLFLGMALADLKRYAEAENPLRAALEKLPRHPEAWLNLARSLRSLGRPAGDVVACLRRAVELEPDRAETHEQLGELLVLAEGLPAAEPHFRRAVELQPGLSCAWTNLGLALLEAPGRFREAVECLNHAVKVDPMSADAYAGRALARLCAYRQEAAARDYEEAISLEPGNFRVHSARTMLANYLASCSRSAVFAVHRDFGRHFDGTAVASFDQTPDPGRRLRIGFVSPDLRAHPVACFFEPLLRHLDRDGFEVLLYHNDARVDATSERLRQMASAWTNLHGLADTAAENLIRRDAPDVLVDLAGHSSGNRLTLFARRLAPVQITYLGYPNTTGLTAMDYRFTDAVVDPPGEADPFTTEKLVRFAPTAWAYAPSSEAPPVAPGPERSGVPLTFGSFNNFTKVTDEMLRVWSQLLTQVPNSRLVLKSRYFDESLVVETVRARLRAAGLPDGRVELLQTIPTSKGHLEAYAQVDIALDTFPYHGTTTTCEAMWMGVPVVTLAGDRHAARVGCSLLGAAGHPEWIAATTEDYIRIAVGLAADSARRITLRAGLRDQMAASSLLDHAGQASRFGAALRECWSKWCATARASHSAQQ
jgi:predicted O-linked N-acetylglucosamine transferase (SPINDLY family)